MYFLSIPFSFVSYILYKIFRANFYYNKEFKHFLNSKEFSRFGKFYKLKSKRRSQGADLLIIGDSMSLGIGSEKLALHKQFSESFGSEKTIDVVGLSGARAHDLYQMSKRIKGKYKAIWVFIGPNDVTSINVEFNKYLNLAFGELKKHSGQIVWSVGDVHIAPLIPNFTKFIPKYFGNILKRNCYKVAKKNGVSILKIVHTHRSDPFYMTPKTHFAKDGFHPNDRGYTYIFSKLLDKTSFK